MNTNVTQDYEIPADWDVTVQGYYRQGYRAGVEAMRDELCEVWPEDSRFSRSIRTVINQEADKLLAEQEQKETTIQGAKCGHM
jgi:hypothetical protein